MSSMEIKDTSGALEQSINCSGLLRNLRLQRKAPTKKKEEDVIPKCFEIIEKNSASEYSKRV